MTCQCKPIVKEECDCPCHDYPYPIKPTDYFDNVPDQELLCGCNTHPSHNQCPSHGNCSDYDHAHCHDQWVKPNTKPKHHGPNHYEAEVQILECHNCEDYAFPKIYNFDILKGASVYLDIIIEDSREIPYNFSGYTAQCLAQFNEYTFEIPCRVKDPLNGVLCLEMSRRPNQ